MACWKSRSTGAPLLTFPLDQGLIAPGEHFTHRCSDWSEELLRQRGWRI